MVLEEAARLKRNPDSTLLAGKVLATLFFEPSTRTRLSFTFAMQRLGGAVAGFADPSVSSTKKGETLADTIRMVSGYADAIVMRHPQEGAARWASEVSSVPIINAGDGANQHPTQTLLDLFTIEEAHGKIDGLHIAMVGDLKYGRTVHSLAEALSHYNVTISFVAPNSLQMPKHVLEHLEEKHISYHLFERIEDVIDQADVLYMTRIQQERFPDPVEYERLKHCFHLHPELVAKGKSELSILHPLPRITEIDPRVDALPQAKYFQQAKNGLFVRQALLRFLLAQ